MKVSVSLKDCVELFEQRAGDEYEDPEIRAACVLAAHTLKALVSKNKKYWTKQVEIKVEIEGENDESNSVL